MSAPSHSIDHRIHAALRRMLVDGVLGFYTHFEVTEVFAKHKDRETPVNVFTIVVAESREPEISTSFSFLGGRISIKGLRGWAFGVVRYIRPIAELLSSLEKLAVNGIWNSSSNNLAFGPLQAFPPEFVPPDALDDVPWNRVLKNNFWNGSHIFQWADAQKSQLNFLLADARHLQELSKEVLKLVPISLASLSDKLGNLIVQLPVTVMMSRLRPTHNNQFRIDVAWHPKATPRPLLAQCSLEFDQAICAYRSSRITDAVTLVEMPDGRGMYSAIIWDDAQEVVLAAMAPTGFISTISITSNIVDPEPRTFLTRQKGGEYFSHRIQISGATQQSLVGEEKSAPNGLLTQNRIYRDEIEKLTRERRFVQYKPGPLSKAAAHQVALEDLRGLIRQFGTTAAWLWDPYLSAQDVLQTLFHCNHAGSNLRALTEGTTDFRELQRTNLEAAQSNCRGLNLEYRIRTGDAGWKFHDRFLIFPRSGAPTLAWSLGTSVNSFGKEHHILQQVANGQMVMDAFVDLWEQLEEVNHLVWKV